MKKLTTLTLVIALAFVVVSATPTLAKENGKKNGQTLRERIETQIQKLQNRLANLDNNDSDHEDKDKKDKKNYNNNDRDEDCIPFGIKNAKGIAKRIENGKGLPHGIAKKIGDNKFCVGNHNGNGTTTTPTTTPVVSPKILDINVSKATSTATVSWRTNINTVGEVRFGSTTPVTASSTVLTDATLTTLHSVSLSNLSPNTTYFYVIVARDTNGNVKESVTRQFRTDALAQPVVDTTAPNIVYSTKVDLMATSTHLAWITNEPTTGKVWVSTTTPVIVSATSTQSDVTLNYFHNVMVGNLATSTLYYFTIMATDASNNSTSLTGGTFTTLAQ